MQKNAFNEHNTQQVDSSRNGNNIFFAQCFIFLDLSYSIPMFFTLEIQIPMCT